MLLRFLLFSNILIFKKDAKYFYQIIFSRNLFFR